MSEQSSVWMINKPDEWRALLARCGSEAANREGLRQLCARQGRAEPEALRRENDRIYPCHRCGTPRSQAEGGTTFTVCDDCWDKPHEALR